ncbi:MAG: SulP family inorganic anion transporter [Planctomycetota bacterium]|jgi:MFS superfamily sulfate permease-like transporter
MSNGDNELPDAGQGNGNEEGEPEQETFSGSAAFQLKYLSKDIQAGIVTGVMAIPLSIGIAMMSDYPIKVGLATVVFACICGWIMSWFRPGNFLGAPGIAAGLAPVLAMGVSYFGMENMAFLIFLTATFQAIIWKFNLQRFILRAVPVYLVEGLLAGIGLKIAMKFLPFTYELSGSLETSGGFWTLDRLYMCILSLVSFGVFVFLYSKYKKTQPAIAYFTLVIAGILFALFVADVPRITVADAPLEFAAPIPSFASPLMWIYGIGFALLLSSIDVIEQVMSNAAIEKLDPLKRKCNSNNSLLAIWISNMGVSFFGGMTNLDGLAKSTTNTLAGARTKFSVIVIGSVVAFFVHFSHLLEYLPKFALAVLMIFTGWKMISGLFHVAHHGRYPLVLSLLCGALVYRLGIFEGLTIALIIHGLVNFVIYSHVDKDSAKVIIRRYFRNF